MSGSFAPLNFGQFQAPDLVGMSNAAQTQSTNMLREQQLMGDEREKNAMRALFADPNFNPNSPDAAQRVLAVAPRTGHATYTALLRGYADRRAAEASVRAGAASDRAAALSARQAEAADLDRSIKLTQSFRDMLPTANAENYPVIRAAAVAAVPRWAPSWPETYDANAVRALMQKADDSIREQAERNKPPADYTLNNTRFSGATNQPIATADPRDTARDARIRSIMETQNAPLQIAAGIVDGVLTPITDPVTGQTRMFNKANNTFLEFTPAPAAPAAPAAPPAAASLVTGPRAGVTPPPAAAEAAPTAASTAAPTVAPTAAAAQPTLYDLAQIRLTTGLVPAAGEFLQRGLGQVGVNVVSPEFTARRQRFETAKNEALRAWALNTRFPVAEMERILKDYDITAAKFTDPQTLVTNIRNATSELRRRLANEERAGSDLNLPVSERQQARISANNIANFLKLLGGPEEPLAPQAPDRAPRGSNTLNRQTQTGARPPAAPPVPQGLDMTPDNWSRLWGVMTPQERALWQN